MELMLRALTDGEWVANYHPSDGATRPKIVVESSDNVICEVFTGYADAKLLAASKDLLEALQELHSCLQSKDDLSNKDHAAMVKLREAQEKALK